VSTNSTTLADNKLQGLKRRGPGRSWRDRPPDRL